MDTLPTMQSRRGKLTESQTVLLPVVLHLDCLVRRPPLRTATSLLVLTLSKWFYDIFTGVTTEVVRCGSFMENVFSLLVVNSR
jgi:hypothetical protein